MKDTTVRWLVLIRPVTTPHNWFRWHGSRISSSCCCGDEKVLLGQQLAELYGVPVKVLIQSVKRNHDRFPEDFMFQLSREEFDHLKSQMATSNMGGDLRSQFVTLKPGQHPKYLPYAFTEQGVAMLSSVLRSPRAVAVNIEIMRAFVKLRQMLASNVELAGKLAALEKKYDAQFKVVFEAIRALMSPPEKPRREIGFHVKEASVPYRVKRESHWPQKSAKHAKKTGFMEK